MAIPTNSERVRNEKDLILKTWVERVRKAIPAETGQRTPALINSIPKFLDELARALEAKSCEEEKIGCASVSREHGEQRAQLGHYTLDELIREYQILHQVILEFLNRHGPASDADVCAVTDGVFSGIRGAAQAFVEKQFEEYRAMANEARESQQLRELFVNALAHDIRNPLATALIHAEIIQRAGGNYEIQVNSAAKIAECVRKTGRIIDDVLDANHLRAGQKLRLHVKKCDLEAIVKEAAETMAAMYNGTVVINNGHHIAGHWDCDKISRAIQNLISNALKYGDRTIPVTVTLSEVDEHASISVHNHGSELTMDDLSKLFRPHYRSGRARESTIDGYGLGLTLVKGFLEAHGGRVLVKSRKDEGTTFTLILPKQLSKDLSEHVK